MHLSVFTGYKCQKGSFSRSPCRLIRRSSSRGASCCWHCMLVQYCTSRTTDILSRQIFGPLSQMVCLFLSSDFQLLDIVPFLLLVHVYATIYLQVLPTHTGSPFLLTFKQQQKMHLFHHSYPGLSF